MARRVSASMVQETRVDERILTEAARWHARLAAEDCTDFDRVQFQRWRAASWRHAQAYESAEALSSRLEHRAGLDETLRSMADEAFAMGAGDEPGSSPRERAAGSRYGRPRRWMVPAALAASVAVALVGVLSAYFATPAPPVTYASPEQTRRDIALGDGSLVHLDVDSQISVSFSGGRPRHHARERAGALRGGARRFAALHGCGGVVTHDRARHAFPGTTRERARARDADRGLRRSDERFSRAGLEREARARRADYAEQGRSRARGKRAIDAQVATSWSRGRLIFRGTPLAEALQEINRYGHRKVRLGDADLADLPVDGNFIAGESDLIVSAFAAALPLRIAEGSVGEIILFRRYKADVH